MPPGRIGFTLAIAAFVVSGCGSDSAPPRSGPSPVPVSQFQFDGYVEDMATRQPVSATVALLDAGAGVAAESRTDSAGRYTFGPVPAGSYTLRARAAGYDEWSEPIRHDANETFTIGLRPAGIVLLMLTGGGPVPCTPTKTGATSISVLNSSLHTVAITIKGGLYDDPATKGVVYQFTLPPSASTSMDVVAGSYETSGASVDGKALLQTNPALFSKGCDLPFEICPLNGNRTCR